MSAKPEVSEGDFAARNFVQGVERAFRQKDKTSDNLFCNLIIKEYPPCYCDKLRMRD